MVKQERLIKWKMGGLFWRRNKASRDVTSMSTRSPRLWERVETICFETRGAIGDERGRVKILLVVLRGLRQSSKLQKARLFEIINKSQLTEKPRCRTLQAKRGRSQPSMELELRQRKRDISDDRSMVYHDKVRDNGKLPPLLASWKSCEQTTKKNTISTGIMGKQWCSLFIITFFELCTFTFSRLEQVTPPPLPILPLPTYHQLKWQQREIIMFLHFGVNTFTGLERGTGNENPAIFNPVALDATQWVSVAEHAGISLMILTAKHHDGFCLWPSKYTDHTVKRCPWKNGHGDVVQELVDAAKPRGVDVGLYGSLREIWFDGFKGGHAPNMSYIFTDWFSMVKELQSSINIFSDAGPDVRWVGNEDGFSGESC
ncbi:hypothetical protein ACLB2K_071173 [Fragaria x ananassa]